MRIFSWTMLPHAAHGGSVKTQAEPPAPLEHNRRFASGGAGGFACQRVFRSLSRGAAIGRIQDALGNVMRWGSLPAVAARLGGDWRNSPTLTRVRKNLCRRLHRGNCPAQTHRGSVSACGSFRGLCYRMLRMAARLDSTCCQGCGVSHAWLVFVAIGAARQAVSIDG